METAKSGSSKLIVMTVLEPKDELDEVKFLLKFVCLCRASVVAHSTVVVTETKYWYKVVSAVQRKRIMQ